MLKKWLIFALPLGLAVACLAAQPFPRTLHHKNIAIRTLSQAQRSNLAIAARYLDGRVLKPGERFSFNQVVGPRTLQRGYRPAPSYLGGDSPNTVGGGICLLSSGLYQLALESGLTVTRRVPHLRTIHSVPPGLDATVWYGGADLELENTLLQPIQLKVGLDSGQVKVILMGSKPLTPLQVKRQIYYRNRQEILVTVFQGQRMVSRDLNRLSP